MHSTMKHFPLGQGHNETISSNLINVIEIHESTRITQHYLEFSIRHFCTREIIQKLKHLITIFPDTVDINIAIKFNQPHKNRADY